MSEITISVVDSKTLLALMGTCDQHLRAIREALAVSVTARDGQIELRGDDQAVAVATEVFERLKGHVSRHETLTAEDVARALSDVQSGQADTDAAPLEVFGGRRIRPRSAGQARYVAAIQENDLVFCSGPAGTGKTYLAVAVAAAWLQQQRIRKIVLVRPAVEAGESLGFLPGDLQAKINPYLRPLLDALREMIDREMIQRLVDEDVIEVIPLAYMRGRTLNEAFIILDEAQNTTISQMKMFLTRMGNGSKIVVGGDTTQIDLPAHSRSGLVDALQRLKKIPGCASIQLNRSDIVRHPLVQRIVDAYERGRKA